MQKNYIYRGGFYLVGLLVLALGTLSEYEDGTWGLSHHLRILQHIHNLESKLWKYDDGTLLYLCSGRNTSSYHPVPERTET